MASHEYDKHLPALLVRESDKDLAIAVLIDGNTVGYLTEEAAKKHRRQLDELKRSGQHLVCSALIVGGGARRISAFGSRSSLRLANAGR
jgi:hypothetical protein